MYCQWVLRIFHQVSHCKQLSTHNSVKKIRGGPGSRRGGGEWHPYFCVPPSPLNWKPSCCWDTTTYWKQNWWKSKRPWNNIFVSICLYGWDLGYDPNPFLHIYHSKTKIRDVQQGRMGITYCNRNFLLLSCGIIKTFCLTIGILCHLLLYHDI